MFAGLFLLVLANGLVLRIYSSIEQHGLGNALLAMFDISVIVWAACTAAPILMARSADMPLRRFDRTAAALTIVASALPLADASWIAATGLALYLLGDPPVPDALGGRAGSRRAASVLLAIAGSMFWGRLILHNGGDLILDADASVVALLTGMDHEGNVIRTAGNGGYLWISPFCSSLANISLAILCCVTFANWRGLAWTSRQTLRCLLACLSVVLINDVRIGLMVLRPELYDELHGSVGAGIAGWLTGLCVITIAVVGNREEKA